MKQTKVGPNPFIIKRLVPAFVALMIAVCISTLFLPGLMNVVVKNNVKDKFKITEETSTTITCYASVVFMDGYVYSPSEWLKYSRYSSDEIKYDEIRGDKLGEVSLDLKRKRYTGIPPSFSSTHNIGTEISSLGIYKKNKLY